MSILGVAADLATFFDQENHAILKNRVAGKVHDKRTLELAKRAINLRPATSGRAALDMFKLLG